MREKLKNIQETFSNNKKVVENYFFMTMLQVINSLFGVLIYPFIIRLLGPESYGLYVFGTSIASYFVGFISFGFSFPAMKQVILHKENQQEKNVIISTVILAKSYLTMMSIIIFALLIVFVPPMRQNKFLFSICFFQTFGEIFSFFWFFQSIQKMKVLTYIQFTFKILTLPFVFLLIKSSSDTWIYALTVSISVIGNGLVSLIYLMNKENFKFSYQPLNNIITLFKSAFPFFGANFAELIKQEGVTIIIGSFIGMREVALYDLANKIVMLPRILSQSINNALFPKIIGNAQKSLVRKIIKYETYLGLFIISLVGAFGYWLVRLLGGINMVESYPLAVILSVTILVWLLVGSYITFVFVPQNKYYFTAKNQIVALVSFFMLCIPGLLLYNNILTVVISLSLSGLCEVFYCYYITKRHHLL